MEAKQKCPYCGKEIPTDAKKCRYCGEWLNSTDKESGDNANIHIRNKKLSNSSTIPKIWKTIFIVIGSLLGVLVLLATIGLFWNEDYIDNFNPNERAEIKYCLDSCVNVEIKNCRYESIKELVLEDFQKQAIERRDSIYSSMNKTYSNAIFLFGESLLTDFHSKMEEIYDSYNSLIDNINIIDLLKGKKFNYNELERLSEYNDKEALSWLNSVSSKYSSMFSNQDFTKQSSKGDYVLVNSDDLSKTYYKQLELSANECDLAGHGLIVEISFIFYFDEDGYYVNNIKVNEINYELQ